MKLQPGFWRSDNETELISECVSVDACPQSLVDNEQCREGHTGVICDVCVKGYDMGVDGVCDKCEEHGAGFNKSAAIPVYVACGVLALVIVSWIRRRVAARRRRAAAAAAAQDSLSSRSLTASLLSNDKSHWTAPFKSKAKILLVTFQIVADSDSTFQVRFPNPFYKFCRYLSTGLNLDFLKFFSVGCVVETNFYHHLLVTTLFPIVIYICIFFLWLVRRRGLKEKELLGLTSSSWTYGLAVSFLVFSSTSTTAFNVFLCESFSNDDTRYLTSDHSLDCESSLHHRAEQYAAACILVYPFGTTLLYAVLLFKKRVSLQQRGREADESLSSISFLWDNYHRRCWWFEVFECVRRLSLTGMLVFVEPGSAKQLVIAILLAIASVTVYSNVRPFIKQSDNTLAILSQWAIFFTLFGALLIKAEFRERNGTEEKNFGLILMLINCLGIGLVVTQLAVIPIKFVSKKCGRQHRHEGALKGLGDMEDESQQNRVLSYMQKLSASSEEEAGWESVKLKSATSFHWRCSEGNGGRDCFRLVWEVHCDLDRARDWCRNYSAEKRGGEVERTVLRKVSSNRKLAKGYRVLYTALRMPSFWTQRDAVVGEFHRDMLGGGFLLALSTVESEADDGAKERGGRVRCEVDLRGWLVEAQPGGETCRVTYCYDGKLETPPFVDPDYFFRKFAVFHAREVMTDSFDSLEDGGSRGTSLAGEEGDSERGGSEVLFANNNPMFKGKGPAAAAAAAAEDIGDSRL
jgi:hypothetical protein